MDMPENKPVDQDKQNHSFAAQITTFLLAIIPFIGSCPTCPTCFPIYSAILSLFGLKLADYSFYLLPFILISMSISLRSMYQDITTQNLPALPFIGALISCTALLVFKYILAFPLLSYIAMLGLLTATLFHNRSVNHNCTTTDCTNCKTPFQELTTCIPIGRQSYNLNIGARKPYTYGH